VNASLSHGFDDGPDFSPDLFDQPGHVRPDFGAVWRQWHRTARFQDALDGSCVLTLKVSRMGGIKRWLPQFGAEASGRDRRTARW